MFDDGDVTPYEAAFTLIGQHNAEGHYMFPHESGETVHVAVHVSEEA